MHLHRATVRNLFQAALRCSLVSPLLTLSPLPSHQSRSLGRAAAKADTRVSELQGLIEELQWDMEKIRRRENRLNARLSEILERVSPVPSLFQRGSFLLSSSQVLVT